MLVVRQFAPRMLGGAIAGLIVSALLLGLFFLLNAHSLGRDLPAARAHILAAYEQGELQDQDWPRGNTQIGQHQFNDCLILGQAVDQREPAEKLGVSPTWPGGSDLKDICTDLRTWLTTGEVLGPTVYYHNYIHGHTMLARYLLPHMGVGTMRMIYKNLVVLAVFAGIALSLFGLARGKARIESLFWLLIFFAFARFFGLEAFDQSLGHGPADLVFLLAALALCAASLRGGMGLKAAILLASLFGSLTIIFEFLTGGIPLGLALMTGGMAFALRKDRADTLAADCLTTLSAFSAAVATGLIGKAVVTISTFGLAAVQEAGSELAARMALAKGPGEPVETGLYLFVRGVLKGLDGLVPGTHLLSGLMILGAIAAGLWGAVKLWRTPDALLGRRVRLLLVSNLLIAIMLLGMWQHTQIHAWFMNRVLAWTIGSGLMLFALAVIDRARGEGRIAS